MIFLGLGTNIGNKSANIHHALELLGGHDVMIQRVSALYRTPPWGILEQESFINAVCEVRFEGDAEQLLEIVLDIETKMGRIRAYKWGPRLIDIDIIEFNRVNIDLPHLQIPHPFYTQRAFVLVPLSQLEPAWIPTGGTTPIRKLLENVDTTEIVKVV